MGRQVRPYRDDDEFRRHAQHGGDQHPEQCGRSAQVDGQRKDFIRMGVFGDWFQPYLTMNYRYEAIIARECCKFALNGSLFRSKKPIYWCNSCKTALAEAEIELLEFSEFLHRQVLSHQDQRHHAQNLDMMNLAIEQVHHLL